MTIFGIDLGTTNSLIALYRDGRAELAPNRFGQVLTPSIVSLDDNGALIVGSLAKEISILQPHKAARVFKRGMGSTQRYNVGSASYTAVELSSFVLRSLKEDAEHHFKIPVTRAVISVPAYFNNHQRQATIQAAQLAGITVERLINEPTAAALAYSLHDQEEDAHILVLDLGGGTFDVSIIEKFDDIMEIHASGGDNFLGGEDFTKVMEKILGEKAGHLAQDAAFVRKTPQYAEQLKVALANTDMASLEIVGAADRKRIEVSRQEFEKRAEELIERIKAPILRTLRDSGLKPQDITHVVLVGGSTRLFFMRRLVTSLLGKMPTSHLDPDTVVAIGAASQAALISKNQGIADKVLTDVCPYSLGVEIAQSSGSGQYEAGIFSPIIERNQPIPCSRSELYRPIHPKQKELNLRIFQGESLKVENNILIGELSISLGRKEPEKESIEVRFTYDISGVLEVEATVVSTGARHRIIINNSASHLSDAELNQRFLELAALKIHPRDQAANQHLLTKAERLYEETLGDVRNYLSELIITFKGILNQQNPQEIEKAQQDFAERLAEIEGRL
ncbi:MAG TPA: Hsp70 family protein [Oligoflexus sp.]|uniref:Hsp70 family protein n=1 Tax=Oligoflexus sp. TaxID=1971216 RepID=UPI002D7F0AAE|nr:Hsp70 family protein [Oligoflexus sp.]HET9240290.1 Hsp70 family protein [Oligoflexus sp.]